MALLIYPALLMIVAYLVLSYGSEREAILLFCYMLSVGFLIDKKVKLKKLKKELWTASLAWVRDGHSLCFKAREFTRGSFLPEPVSRFVDDSICDEATHEALHSVFHRDYPSYGVESMNYEVLPMKIDSFCSGDETLETRYKDQIYSMRQIDVHRVIEKAQKLRSVKEGLWEWAVLFTLLTTWPILAFELSAHMHPLVWFGMATTIPLRDYCLCALVKMIEVQVPSSRGLEQVLEHLPSGMLKHV